MPEPSRATSTFLDLYQLNPVRADLELLGEVTLRFTNLPWENLTKFLRKHRPREPRAVHLPEHLRNVPDAEKLRLSNEVMADHARYGAGGTCFSLTNTLRRITRDLGFDAWPVMADMRHGPNVHCAVLVELNGKRFLLDPGYLVSEPVPLPRDRPVRVEQPGHRLEYRAVDGSDEVELHTLNDRGEDVFRYRLRPRRVRETEFVRFWLDSFGATGMNGLHLNRFTGAVRLSAHDLNLRIDTGRRKTNVKLREDYVGKVSDRFGIHDDLVRQAYREWERRRCRGG